MKVFSKIVSLTAFILAVAPLASQATNLESADAVKAQSCLSAFVDRYLPGQSPAAKLDSGNSDRSLSAAQHFEMQMTAATRDGRVIATALCKVDQGVATIRPSASILIAAN